MKYGFSISYVRKTPVLLVLLCSVMMIALTGCGRGPITMTTVSLEKDGKIAHTIIEKFEDAALLPNLQDMILEETASYDSQHEEDSVVLKKAEILEDGRVQVEMDYKSGDDFAAFHNQSALENVVFFYGTVKDADERGLDLNVMLSGREDPSDIADVSDILSMEDHWILIYDSGINNDGMGDGAEDIEIRADKSILYASENVKVEDKETAIAPASNSLSYILFD